MRVSHLLLGAAGALAAATLGWVLLRDPGPGRGRDGFPPEVYGTGPAGGGRDAAGGGTGPAGPGATGPDGRPLPAGAGGDAGTAPPPREFTPEEIAARVGDRADAERIPPPPSERGSGPVEGKWTPAESKRVESLRTRTHETILKKLDFRRRRLGDVLKELADAGGITIDVSGEGVADEPVNLQLDEAPLHEVLMQITMRRNLWFQVEPDRVVVGR